jgi:hypothetical protein
MLILIHDPCQLRSDNNKQIEFNSMNIVRHEMNGIDV